MKPIYVCDDANAHARDSNTKEQCAVCGSKDLQPAFFADDLLKEIEKRVKKYESFLLTPNELTSDGGIIGELQSLADKIQELFLTTQTPEKRDE